MSLDHTDPVRRNAFRGRADAFGIALRMLKLSGKYGFYTMNCCVATPEVVAEKEYRNIHALSAEFGVDELRIVKKLNSKFHHEKDGKLALPCAGVTHLPLLCEGAQPSRS